MKRRQSQIVKKILWKKIRKERKNYEKITGEKKVKKA